MTGMGHQLAASLTIAPHPQRDRTHHSRVTRRVTRDLKQVILNAAARVGFDGNGKGGIEGYLMWAARKEPKSFMTLLGRALPHTVHATLDMKPLLTRDEAIAELKLRGLPTSLIDQLDFIKIGDSKTHTRTPRPST
jgi:hypothetical protein